MEIFFSSLLQNIFTILFVSNQVWFSDDMFKEEFNFFKGYKIPKVNSIDEFREAIVSLPAMDTPEVFGLHANADIT